MQPKTRFSRNRQRRRQKERGVALLAVLLLLMLMTGLSVAMVMSVRSDLLINGFYRNYRGSFYAADSGLNIARQDMVNQINNDLAALGPTYNPATTPPLSAAEDANIQSYLNTTYGGGYQSLNQGSASGAWPGKYKIASATFTFAQCTPIGTDGTCAAPTNPLKLTGYDYIYSYSLTAVGQSAGNQAVTLLDSGSVFVKATGNIGTTTTSFSGWGLFIDSSKICDGSILVPGTVSGPVFTNGSWNFGSTGQYIFTDSVGSNGGQAGFQFPGNGNCDQLAATSDQQGGQTIAPTFQHGFNLGQPKVPLPPNSYNQERAVLDSMGTNNTQPSKQDLANSNLKDITGTSYPKNGTSSGVFLPYTTDNQGNPTGFAGGGILVEGDAKVTLSTGANGTAQIYTIVQGSTTTIVTVDNGGNNNGTGTTTFTSGGNTVTIPGVPTMKDPNTGLVTGADTMLYVDGNITSLSGPGEGIPAIQDHNAVTITAAGNVTITGDILYNTEPVTTTQNQIPNTPADTLIPQNQKGQALGIFTATGDIQLNNLQSDKNIEIDASLAAICDPTGPCGQGGGGTGGLVNVGSKINTLTIVGGRIQNTGKDINTTTRNVFFDRRYGQGFAPPWFPSTTVTPPPGAGTVLTTSVSRTQWANTSSYY